MLPRNMRRSGLIILPAILIAGFAHAADAVSLARTVEDMAYRALLPPRSGNGVGTVTRIEAGREKLVASASTMDCLGGLKGVRQSVALPAFESTIRRTRGGGISTSALLAEGVDASAAFSDSRVAQVKIKFVRPFEQQISEFDLVSFFEALPPDSPCKKVLRSSGNRITMSILGAEAVEYELLDNRGRTVALEGSLLARLGTAVNASASSSSTTSLISETPLYFGVRDVWTCELVSCDGMTVEQRRELRQIVRAAVAHLAEDNLYLAPDIPDQFQKKIKSFGLTTDAILLVFDSTLKRTASRGLILTGSGVYWQSTLEPPQRSTYENVLNMKPVRFGFLLNGKDVYLLGRNRKAAAAALMDAITKIKEKRAEWKLVELD